jgi:hypothetical protein
MTKREMRSAAASLVLEGFAQELSTAAKVRGDAACGAAAGGAATCGVAYDSVTVRCYRLI